MYLLKLRCGDDFCTAAGSSWRLIFVYVLMPWLSKYRIIRRAQLGVEHDGASIKPTPPIRAVSLVDARAYALRAVSLIPVTSGFIGGYSHGLGGLADKDELRVLRAENKRLREQLRLMEREILERDDDELSYVPPPAINPDSHALIPAFSVGQIPPAPSVTRDNKRVGLPDEEGMPSLPPPKLKRDYSAGLAERGLPSL